LTRRNTNSDPAFAAESLARSSLRISFGPGILCAVLFASFTPAASQEALPNAHTNRPPAVPQICGPYEKEAAAAADVHRTISGDCGMNQALFATHRPYTFEPYEPELLQVYGTCCPLPAGDILLQEKTAAVRECPDGYVATGAEGMAEVPDANKPKHLTCSKINTARYQLGPSTPGIYWGFGHTHWQKPVRILFEEIPAALRYAVGVRAYGYWNERGCIGFPFGSMLVAKNGFECHQTYYRELQYRGLPGDPPAGTPVPMLPDCDELSDLHTPHPACIKYPAPGRQGAS